MTIHHTVVKAAAAKGITLTLEDDVITAAFGEQEFTIDVDADGGSDTEQAKDIWVKADDIRAFQGDHPTIQIEQDGEDWIAVKVEDGEEVAREADLADLFEAVRNLDADDAEGEEADEEDDRRTVVPTIYKRRYAEAGHPNTCGDWLAMVLNGICLTPEGFQIGPMLAICDANGVDGERYLARKTLGWQGRFRMSARNKLKGVVAKAGVLFIPEGLDEAGEREMEAPAEWVAANTPKAKGKVALAA